MSSLRTSTTEQNCWELSKENIQPLKSGRSISNVNSANEISLKQQRQNFEEELRLNDGDDPLDVWYRYLKWTEQNFPSGKDNQLRSLVQKCLSALKEQKQYANDFRWWYVWQKFALLSSNVGSLGIYEFMHSSDHCSRLASFYKQWAFELEQAGDFTKAADVYRKGILATAQPLSDLENAFHEFELRVGRKLMSQADDEVIEEECTRNFLGVLKGVGKKATAPFIRQSSVQEVKLTKPVEKMSGTGRGFAIFDEKLEMQSSSSQNSNGTTLMNVGSVGNESTKENFRTPGIWTKQKVKLGNAPIPKDNAAEFRVFVDENTTDLGPKPKTFVPGSVLKPAAKQEPVSNPLRSQMVEKPKTVGKSELKEVPAYDEHLIYGGLIEMSFEELRALKYQSKVTKSCSNVPMNTSSNLVKKFPVTTTILPCQKSNPLPNPPAIVANSSFTSNVYRDAMAVFSNTLQLNCFSEAGSNPSGLDGSSKSEQSFEPSMRNSQLPSAPAAGGFKIFDENADCNNRSHSSTLPVNNENKENWQPPDMVSQKMLKRQTSGILTPALDIISEPVEKVLGDVVPSNLVLAEHSFKSVYTPASAPCQFDDYDPTVAGLMKSLLAEQRASSTPCHTQSFSSEMVPSFSLTKPWQIPFEVDNNASFETEEVNARQEALKIEETSRKAELFEKAKLSTITETSREYRSSSCSSTSSGSSGDAFSNRKRLLCASTNSTNLQPISEQLTFAHCTPSSQAAPFGFTPQDLALSSIVRLPTTPHDALSANPLAGEAKAVRRLYSNGENLDENVDRTGFGTKISITSRINPWDPEIIAQLLMRVPKRLDTFTNYHHFATNLANIKVGKSVELGGEKFNVESFIGEGAFARVYKCSLEDNPHSPLVLKVQKPCCPWEFYVCEELRRRLANQHLLSKVSRAIMRLKDAYLFVDGSVLLYDYCPYGTLLDVVNKLKKSSMSLNEPFVVYLTIEMMKILESAHACGFIHADVKPDNFLFCGPEQWPSDEFQVVHENQVQCLCLIDWGRAIDMTLMPPGTVFTGQVNTSGFQCCEMQEGKPWTFQTDYYGLLGTIHVLLFGDYMRVYKCSSSGRWKTTSAFKRKWNIDMWRKLFDSFLNITDCNNLPNLAQFRFDFEQYYAKCEKDRVGLNDELINLKNIIQC